MEFTVKFEGFVEKTSAFFKNKTKIWMVLEGLTLTHFKDSKKTFCVGSIDLTEVQAARQTGQKLGREFEVTTKSTTFTFTVETDELALAWVRVIQQAMLQKPVTNDPSGSNLKSKMFSSEYAEVGELTTTVESNPQKSRIYEELSEIQPTQERNIFGVKLKSSFHRAHSTSFSEDTLKQDTKKTSKEPEPVYAKPDKTRAQQNTEACPKDKTSNAEQTSKTYGKGVHKPPPSFAPPPPPMKLNDNAKDSGGEIPESGKMKNKPDTEVSQTSATQNDDDHEYYFADAVKRPNAESSSNSDDIIEKGKTDVSDLKTYESTYEEIDCSNASVTVNTDIAEKRKPRVNEYEDIELPKTVMAKTSTKSKSTNSGNHYEDVDITQVIRRSRGSHVTTSFIESTQDSTDETSANELTYIEDQMEKTPAASRRENFRASSEVKHISSEDNETDEVFIDNDKTSTGSSEPEIPTDNAKYSALDAVINSIETHGTHLSFIENGKAFSSLKRYLETNCEDGFDLESHKVSSRDSIEKLKALLSTKL